MSEGRDWATLSPEEFAQLQQFIDCEYRSPGGSPRVCGGRAGSPPDKGLFPGG